MLSSVLVAALAWTAVAGFWRTKAEPQATRFTIAPPDGLTLPSTFQGQISCDGPTQLSGVAPVAVSPDGRRVAFIARGQSDKDMLWVRPLDALTAQMLPETEGVSAPFWSPDSRMVAFFAGGKLKKIDISGGPPTTICDVRNGVAGSWSRDGVILFSAASPPNLIRRVSAAGGVPSNATVAEQGDRTHTYPMFLPDGRHFLYTMAGVNQVFVGALDAPGRTKLLESESRRFSFSLGHLIFMRGTTLMAQPFDAGRLALTGEAFPVAESVQVQIRQSIRAEIFSASENGLLVYRSGPQRAAGVQLAWFDREGNRLGTLGDRAQYADVQLSPAGRLVSVSIVPQRGDATASAESGRPPDTQDIWLFDVARGIRTRFTTSQSADFSAIWSPDSARVVFSSNRDGSTHLFEKPADGSSAEKLLLAPPNPERALRGMSWSPDGRYLLYAVVPTRGLGRGGPVSSGGGGPPDAGDPSTELWVLPVAAAGKPSRFLPDAPAVTTPADFSPDGRWVAFVSSVSGEPDVYVTPFPGPGGTTRISAAGAAAPRWRGKEIFYLSRGEKAQMMSATVNTRGDRVEVGEVRALFAVQPAGLRSVYDVSADGQRFLVSTNINMEPAAPTPLTVVVNWTAGLQK